MVPQDPSASAAAPGNARPDYDLEAWRRRVPVLRTSIPLCHCSHSPLIDGIREAVAGYLDSWDRNVMDWDAWMEQVDRAKAAFAMLIGASPGEIALMPSVTAAAAAVASCFEAGAGRRRVLISEAEFPTIGHVWLARQAAGARIDWVPLRDGIVDPEEYDRRIDERTLLVVACHAFYRNGFKQDLARICRRAHAHGTRVFVDAYQTLGIHPVDVKALDVDFLTAGAHKFLLGIPGVAFLYVREELIEGLHPTLTGWFARADIFSFDPRTLDWAGSARRFEQATPPVINAYVARAGIETIQAIGPERIRRWTDHLSRRLVEGGRARGLTLYGTDDVQRKTATTAFVCPGDAMEIERALRRRGVLAAARGQVIRLAPHFYNSVEDVDTGLEALAELVGPGAVDGR